MKHYPIHILFLLIFAAPLIYLVSLLPDAHPHIEGALQAMTIMYAAGWVFYSIATSIIFRILKPKILTIVITHVIVLIILITTVVALNYTS